MRDERRIRERPDIALKDSLARTAAPHQRSVSAARDREPMTTPTSSADRCDRILSLIDECLADVDTGLRVIAGEGRPTPRNPRHLMAVRS